MAVGNVWQLHGVNTPSNFYSQIASGDLVSANDIMSSFPAGHPTPLFKGVRGTAAGVQFTTSQLATLLGEVGQFGADLSGGNTDLYFIKVTQNATRTAAASLAHERRRMAEAFMIWDSIQASHNGEATASVRIVPTYDGTNEPIVPAGSLALAGTPTAAEHFGAGPVELAGTELDGVQDITISLNADVAILGADSESFPTFAYVRAINPVVTITSLEAGAWVTYGLDGTALSGAGLEVWLRKFAEDGTRVAEGTAQHIKFTATSGIILVDSTSAGGQQEARTVVRVEVSSTDDTTNPFTISAASAIA